MDDYPMIRLTDIPVSLLDKLFLGLQLQQEICL